MITKAKEENAKEELIEIKFGLMEVLAGNLNAIQEPETSKPLNKTEMYKAKIRLPIIESILMENGQFICWVFTNSNGYVMKKTSKKLAKDAIILHFIHKIKKHFKANSSPLDVSDEQFLNDLKQFCSVADQNYSKSHLFKQAKVQYLLQIDKMKFIHVNFTDSFRNEFMNILEFVKIINDSNKINTILLIQNFISVLSFGPNELLLSKEKVRYLIVKYYRKDEGGSNALSLYYNKPKLLEQIDCEFKGKTMKKVIKKRLERKGTLTEPKGESADVMKRVDENELIMVNNENLIATMEKIISPFLRLIEKKKQIGITHVSLTFIKVKDEKEDYYAFQHGERLIGVSSLNQNINLNKLLMMKINSKYVPPSSNAPNEVSVKQYEKITKDAFCFGDFCEYIIPQYFKNIKKKNIIDELNKRLIPPSNRFTSREKDDKLPYSLPVFQIKKAYDNPHLVNVVLKAYSIFPKNFNKEAEMTRIINERKKEEEKRRLKTKQKEEERKRAKEMQAQAQSDSVPSSNRNALGLGTSFDSDLDEMNDTTKQKTKTTITLYTPIPNKFRKENYDAMYNARSVCENCFKIYTLIYNFLSNIDETTFQFKSLSKAKDILLQGENLNLNLNLYEDQNQIGNEENLLFQEEIQEISLKKMIKKNLIREKLEEINRNKKKEKVKIGRNNINKKEEFCKAFSYKIDINPRVLKLNLVAEKSKNKFFKLIFNELRTEPESLYQKLCIQKPDDEGANSMKALRMHMGINSHIYNPDLAPINFKAFQPGLEEEYMANIKQSLENKEMHLNTQRENNQIDSDIFLTYKNILKKETNERPSMSQQKEFDSEGDSVEDDESKEKGLALDLSLIREREEGMGRYPSNSRIDRAELGFGKSTSLNECNYLQYEEAQRRRGVRSKTVVLNPQCFLSLYSSIKPQQTQARTSQWRKTATEVRAISENKRNTTGYLPTIYGNLSRKFSNKTLKEREQKKKETLCKEKQNKLKQFIQIDQAKRQKKKEEREREQSKEKEKGKKNEKITLFTIVNDRTITYKIDVPYYYISSPLTKFNEGNLPVTENPLLSTQNMKLPEFIQMGKFKPSRLLSGSEIFVYDANTAIPFKVINETEGDSSKGSNDSGPKIFIVVLNDFFDSFDKYEEEISEVCRMYSGKVKALRCVFFNLPGQSSTMWSKKCVLNNMYYSTFLDRFLFYLSMKSYFDSSYSIILVGFGNGGNIALTYTSFYEKYWDFIHSVVMINSFCENDAFLNRSMVEILKIVNSSKSHNLVDFFIKSVTVNPQTLIDLNIDQGKELYGDEVNPMTLAGYHSITKGYFFNLKINHKVIKTRVVAAHSNQNCFISINNLNGLFDNTKMTFFPTKGVEIPMQKYLISLNSTHKENWRMKDEAIDTVQKSTKLDTSSGKMMNSQLGGSPKEGGAGNNANAVYLEYSFDEILSKSFKRKLIVIEGSHDLKYNEAPCINNILFSYLKFISNNNLFK